MINKNCVIYTITDELSLHRSFYIYGQILQTPSYFQPDLILLANSQFIAQLRNLFMNFKNVYIEQLQKEHASFPVLQTFNFTNIHNYKNFLFVTKHVLLKNNFYELYQFIDTQDEKEVWTSPSQPDVIFFSNSSKINTLFQEIHKSHVYGFAIYNSINLYCEIQNDETVYNTFLNNFKFNRSQNIIGECKQFIDEHLLPLIIESQESLEGNLFMAHLTTQYTDIYSQKVSNFINLLTYRGNITNVLEIGFNAGFSALLMLLTNSHIHITCVDLGEYCYTLPCFRVLQEHFGDRIHLIIGDSQKVIPTLHHKYDLIHIDGGHTEEVASNDIQNTHFLTKPQTILIMDDTNDYMLSMLWEERSKHFGYVSFNMKELVETEYHNIKIRLK